MTSMAQVMAVCSDERADTRSGHLLGCQLVGAGAGECRRSLQMMVCQVQGEGGVVHCQGAALNDRKDRAGTLLGCPDCHAALKRPSMARLSKYRSSADRWVLVMVSLDKRGWL